MFKIIQACNPIASAKLPSWRRQVFSRASARVVHVRGANRSRGASIRRQGGAISNAAVRLAADRIETPSMGLGLKEPRRAVESR